MADDGWTLPGDFPLGPHELEMPGGRALARELDDYLDSKGVRSLMTELGEMLLHTVPANPVRAIIAHLHQNYPDLVEDPTYLAAAAFGDESARTFVKCQRVVWPAWVRPWGGWACVCMCIHTCV